jgi:energy-coupling factor transporter transmembrane protein EcfT
MQLMAMVRMDSWISYSDQQDLFIGSAESGPMALVLVPFVSLLLVSAVVCIVFFVVLSLLRRLTTILPVLLIGCSSLIGWLIIPEWTTLLAPYLAVGVVCGIVSTIFQRLVFERHGRFPKASQTGEYQTVFGYSGIMSQAITDRPEPVLPASPAGNRSDFNVSSFV